MAIIMGQGTEKMGTAHVSLSLMAISQKGLTGTFQLLRAPTLRCQYVQDLSWPLHFHWRGPLNRAPCRLHFPNPDLCLSEAARRPYPGCRISWLQEDRGGVQESQIAQLVFLGKVELCSLIVTLFCFAAFRCLMVQITTVATESISG